MKLQQLVQSVRRRAGIITATVSAAVPSSRPFDSHCNCGDLLAERRQFFVPKELRNLKSAGMINGWFAVYKMVGSSATYLFQARLELQSNRSYDRLAPAAVMNS